MRKVDSEPKMSSSQNSSHRILCRMHRSRAPQLSRRPFLWKIQKMSLIRFPNANLLHPTSYFMPSVAGVFFAGQLLIYFFRLPTSWLYLLYPRDLYICLYISIQGVQATTNIFRFSKQIQILDNYVLIFRYFWMISLYLGSGFGTKALKECLKRFWIFQKRFRPSFQAP